MDYQDNQNNQNQGVDMDDRPRVKKDENGLPEITLADGRVVKYFRKPKGRDAAISNDKKGNSVRQSAELLSRIITIDGQKVNADQLLDLDLDVLNFISEQLPGNF